MNGQRKNGKKSEPGQIIALIAAFALISMGGSGRSMEKVFIVLAVAGIIALIVFLVNRSTGKTPGRSTASSIAAPEGNRAKKGKSRERAVEELPGIRAEGRAITEYRESSTGDTFLRDRQRWTEQLEGFLKNGLIEKEEYNILKARYSKDS